VALSARRKTRVIGAALVVALVASLPASPLLAPVNETADRYWFAGSFAVALLVGRLVVALTRKSVWLAVALIAALTGLGISATWSASSVWGSEVDLWTAAAETAPSSPRAWSSLSRAHRLAGQEALAEKAVLRALDLRPGYVPAQVTRVLNHLWAGHLDSAREQLAVIEPESRLHGEAIKVAAACAERESASEAQACAYRSVPRGLVLGDPEKLRAVSERLLGEAGQGASAPPQPLSQ
jgi:hypothetical protein